MFVSHETYTPARGGSAAAEIHALRQVFGAGADSIVIANTKGMTGHPMGVGIEDVLAVKALETGVVPPVPNFRDVDPELGQLNLSHGGAYPIRYALRLAAGFGSQISMILLRWTPPADGRRRHVDELGYGYRIADRPAWTAWLKRVSGQDDPRLEVVRRTLRVVDGVPAKAAPPPAAVPEPVVPPRPARAGRRCARAGRRDARAGRRGPPSPRSRATASKPGCWRSWPSRRAIRRTCWTWIWTWRRIWGSTRSSRRRCSRRSARRTGSSATTR